MFNFFIETAVNEMIVDQVQRYINSGSIYDAENGAE